MKKIFGGASLLILLSSCGMASETIKTLTNNVKESISLPNIIPAIKNGTSTENMETKDSSNFSFSNLVADKLGL